MKNTLFVFVVLAFILGSVKANAQQRSKFMEDKNKDLNNTSVWFGSSTGINNNTGIIGAHFEMQLKEQTTLYGGTGIGTWGNKFAVGVRRYKHYPLRRALSAGLSFAPGLDELQTQLSVLNQSTQVVVDTNVTLRLLPAVQFNLSWGYYFKIGNKSRMNVELGYSLPLSLNRKYQILTPGYGTTDFGDVVMQILEPRGIIIAIGFTFGT